MIASWFERPLWQRVAAGFLLGIVAGVLAGDKAAVWFKPLGDIYLNLVRMVVVPLVFFSIAASVAKLADAGNVARLGARTLFWFVATSALAVLVGIAFGHLINPGAGLSNLPLGEVKPRTIPTPVEVLIGIVPTNPVKAMADTNVLQVLFFAGLVGAALVSLGERTARLRGLVEEGAALTFRITRWVLQLTPIGTFGLIAWVVGRYGLSSLAPLAKFILAMYLACLFHMAVVYGGLIKLHGLKVSRFFRGAFPAQQMAFATSSSLATLPMTLRAAVERLGVPPSYASFAVPLGANVKMDGCGAIYPAIASIFIAQYFGLELSLTQYVLIGLTAVLGSLGTAGVPGTSIVMLTLTLNTAGLPLEGIGYIIAIDRVVDMMRTATNVTGQLLVPVLVAKEEGILDEAVYGGTAQAEPALVAAE
ncbi:dicarboxylate/amino acid:cation symporter [Chelatococcus sp. SYSU_G07232]|uniref:Dicarboxylate/amino acid:cation symporter n=1 Tax=Chelatococcus albus TaxID=3047466 RepID=A0ABT7AJ66_9HYPH|nr:dicarboxylate/amino acid:cation symporter [Chelatococcus sp. SYSU_G07232]MDJ1158636.1 dicarboxylate/amino acid:cation symporter [Chelatococcus sp. SYSU_G07232]